MKLIHKRAALFALLGLIAPFCRSYAADAPKGFEDPGLLAKVMAGEIVLEEKVSTKTEFRTIGRAFFNKVSPEAYVNLVTNHPHYPQMFEEIKKGTTTSVNPAKTDFTYRMDVLITFGIFSKHIYPEGHQTVIPGADAHAETVQTNSITNLKEYITSAEESTRLIPYENGILVEDDIHVIANKDFSQAATVKQKLKELFNRYISTFRHELQGSY